MTQVRKAVVPIPGDARRRACATSGRDLLSARDKPPEAVQRHGLVTPGPRCGQVTTMLDMHPFGDVLRDRLA